MKKDKPILKKAGKLFAAVALKSGVSSANSACRFGYYQNKIPDEMVKLKEKSH